MKERPDWDSVVEIAEARWKQDKWSQVGKLSSQDCFVSEDMGIDEQVYEVLDEISVELDRVNPDGTCAIDQEEVYRATGVYPRKKHER